MKKILKLKKRHPNNVFHIQKHCITVVAKEFELSKEELKEFNSKGVQAWVEEVKKEIKKSAKKEKK